MSLVCHRAFALRAPTAVGTYGTPTERTDFSTERSGGRKESKLKKKGTESGIQVDLMRDNVLA